MTLETMLPKGFGWFLILFDNTYSIIYKKSDQWKRAISGIASHAH